MFDAAIIGAGIVGALVARELAQYELEVVLLDRSNDVANGSTKANSGIIHAGYDAVPGTNKAKFNALGNPLFGLLCEQLNVEFDRIGSLVVAFSETERVAVERLCQRGAANGIAGLRIVERKELFGFEPNLNEAAVCALYAPQAGIIDPWEITIAAAENAADNGVEILLNFAVKEIEKRADAYKIFSEDREIAARSVINCAGLFSDVIHNMVSAPSFTVTPRKGQYFVLDKAAGDLVNHVLFQSPTEAGKGVLVTRSVHGNLLVGPDSISIDDKDDLDTTGDRLDFVRRSASKISKNIPFNQVIRAFSGLRATPNTKDFVIGEPEDARGFIDVAGIESPGLTAAPAIARYVRELVAALRGGLEKRTDFNPLRRPAVRFTQQSDERKNELIGRDPRFGRVICRCEQITEGEIVDAIHRKAGATTIDGVKKRVRPGMGRCQGGFCQPQVLKILARELERDVTEIVKNERESYILTGSTKCGET